MVEHMESRLKKDILAEVTKSGGSMLLHREEYNPALNQISVVGYRENILADDAKTPAEVTAKMTVHAVIFSFHIQPLEESPMQWAMAITFLRLNTKRGNRVTIETYLALLEFSYMVPTPPKSKAKVDKIIERCEGAGHLRDNVLHYRKEIERCLDVDDENKSYLVDMGIKA
ncbi:hypothetical protein IFM89_001357 [Coptis chinensis]|uniref:Uncharacterized protein n=1 Tax=Coptis chinensis TaxID=261450 RepID=A0A835HCG8_9MAGN|nr:hypothetical protein IFM89_001357 [Coptis chinensis]